jgi:hypothetical protein
MTPKPNKPFPDLTKMSDDEIFDYYDQEVANKDSAAFAFHLVDMVPDSELNPVEMFENSPEFA